MHREQTLCYDVRCPVQPCLPPGRYWHVSGWPYDPGSPEQPSGHVPLSAGSVLQPLLLTPWLIHCNEISHQPLPHTGGRSTQQIESGPLGASPMENDVFPPSLSGTNRQESLKINKKCLAVHGISNHLTCELAENQLFNNWQELPGVY